MTALAAAVLATAASIAVLLAPVRGGRLRHVLPANSGGASYAGRSSLAWLVSAGHQPRTAALVAALVAVPLAGPVAGLAAAVGAALLARALARHREGARQAAVLAAVTRSVAGFAAELRAGRPPVEALDAVARTAPAAVAAPLRAAARSAALGADATAALEISGATIPALGRLAACWRVSARSGAGLADVADALAEDLRASIRRRRELAVEVAASKATARLLACLPLVGLALGGSLGARPVHFLLHTPIGAAVLTGGLLFDVLGLLWIDRLVRGVERRE